MFESIKNIFKSKKEDNNYDPYKVEVDVLKMQVRFQNLLSCALILIVFFYIFSITFFNSLSGENLNMVLGIILGYTGSVVQFHFGSNSNYSNSRTTHNIEETISSTSNIPDKIGNALSTTSNLLLKASNLKKTLTNYKNLRSE